MAIDYTGFAIPKPPPRERKTPKRIRAKAKPRAERNRIAEVRKYCFARERNICRCCRKRPAESLHEIVPRSLGGKVSRTNSIAVCGQLGNGPECHGLCQRKDVRVLQSHGGAEQTLSFEPTNRAAEDWLGVKIGDCIISDPMRDVEAL